MVMLRFAMIITHLLLVMAIRLAPLNNYFSSVFTTDNGVIVKDRDRLLNTDLPNMSPTYITPDAVHKSRPISKL